MSILPESAGQQISDAASDALTPVKPKLRGWLHAGVTPLVLVAGIVLVCLAPTVQSRWTAAVYACSGLLLFGTSALYHRGTWSPRTRTALQRMDHANIYLIIAGSYTPLTVAVLSGTSRTVLLLLIWIGAVLGVVFQLVWIGAPRALSTALYILLGWSIVPFAADLFDAGLAVAGLTAAGGVLYTAGGVVYALKKPDPHPTWFGFHEIFHALTIAAWVTRYIAISIVTYG